MAEAAPYVRPDVQAFLDMLEQAPRPVFTRKVLAQVRQLPPEAMASTGDLPVGEIAVVRNLAMPSPGGNLALRMYDARERREAGPVVVFYHGGGFILGSIETHASLAAEMARALDLPVVSVEYRLAPEHPFPAAPDDAEAAARWISDNGAAFGRTFDGLVLSGDSAGGTLALVTAIALRDASASLPVLLQFPIYPGVRGSTTYPSELQFADGYALELANTKLYDEHYAADNSTWRGVPLKADLRGLPPTVLATASLDPLRDGGRALASALIAAGVPTTYYEGAGLVHGFATYRQAIPSAAGDVATMMKLARSMLDAVASNNPN